MNKKAILLLAIITVLVLIVAIPSIIFFLSKGAPKTSTISVAASSSITDNSEAATTELAVGDATQETTGDKFTLFESQNGKDMERIGKQNADNLLLLASCNSFIYSNGGLSGGAVGVATCICQDTIDMNDFIDSSLGWPVSDEYPDSEYADMRLYLAQLIVSMDKTTKMPKNIYPEISGITQMSIVQYSIATGNQCIIDDNSGIYMHTLSDYMKIGHPKITTINSMVLSLDDNKEFDGVKSDLQATIETDTGKYFVYLMYEQPEGKSDGFKILDMIKLP